MNDHFLRFRGPRPTAACEFRSKMFDIDDLSDGGADLDVAPEVPQAQAGGDDDLDDWETAEDPDAKAARLKAEEAARAEKEAAEKEARKKAKEEKRQHELERQRRQKELREALDAADPFAGDDLFNADQAVTNQEQTDYQNAKDLLGRQADETLDYTQIDIGTFQPDTVPEFEAYRKAIVAKIESMTMISDKKFGKKNLASLAGYLVDGLADYWEASQIKDLARFLKDYYNSKNDLSVARRTPGKGVFFAQGNDLDGVDYDDQGE